MAKSKTHRVGLSNFNSYGETATIIMYNTCKDMKVVFNNGYIKTMQFKEFKNGTFKNPYSKTTHGIGFIGEGRYKKVGVNKKHSRSYQVWGRMMARCYGEKRFIKAPTYKDCTVCEEWHNFQNFAKWYEESYYEIIGDRVELDKDILIKGNKLYSPSTCICVPGKINCMFTKTDSKRGEFPIGVYYCKTREKFIAQCHMIKLGRQEYLGAYETQDEAFLSYKKFKEKYIKDTANEYRDKIPNKLYEAMSKYVVDIND